MACRGGKREMTERMWDVSNEITAEDCTARYVASNFFRRQVIASVTVVSPRDL